MVVSNHITKQRLARRPTACSQSCDHTSRAFFPPEVVGLVAQSSGAFERIKKIAPINFVATFAFWKADTISFESVAAEISTQTGEPVTAQAIHDKMAKPQTQVMFKNLVQLALSNAIDTSSVDAVKIPGINKIFAADSSQIALNKSLIDVLPGTGSKGANASLKVHATFELTTKQFVQLSFSKGTVSDHSAKSDHNMLMKPGDLMLRDLGYFDLDDLNAFILDGRYFVSRIPLSLKTFTDRQGREIDLWAKLAAYKGYVVDEFFGLGAQRLSTRLIALRLPKAEARKRLEEAEKEKGAPLTKAERAHAKWNLYTTNLTLKQASADTIRLLAAWRWQIELVFKSLKSGIGIDRLKAASSANVASAYVWAKLLGAALMLHARLLIESVAPRTLSFMRWINRTAEAFCHIRSLIVAKQFLALARLLERLALRHCLAEKHSKPRTEEKIKQSIKLDRGRREPF